MSWLLIGRGVRLAFFVRVPLLTLLLLAAFGPVSQFTSASALLGNLFDQRNDLGAVWADVFAVAFAAFLLAFTAISTLNLTLHYGTLRFSDNVEAPHFSHHFEVQQKRPGLTFALGLLSACSLVITVLIRTGASERMWGASAAVVALLAASGLTLLAKIAQLALTDPAVTPYPPPLLVFPVNHVPWMDRWFRHLYCWPGPERNALPARGFRRMKRALGRASQVPFRLFQPASQGYLAAIHSDEGTRLKLRSGHVFALALALLALATYVLVGFDKANITASPARVPALAYVLLFLIVICWFLSALAFFFDRYRFPLLLSVAGLAIVTANMPGSDHFFRVETPETVSRLQTLDVKKYLTPSAYLAARAKDQRRLILVATPGGGIQAAAWTAKVLEELDARFPEKGGVHGFRNSVALISSVSGGSLGSMIYAASFTGRVKEERMAENARASAINEVAWGWTSPDFWRTIFPAFRRPLTVDRGWALEQKWAVTNRLSPDPVSPSTSPNNDTYLSDWAEKGTAVPALLFNSMLVERGQHVVFSTTRFPPPNDPRGIANFYDLYPDIQKPFDIRVNTAARLSASFPYVAPAARSNLRSASTGDFHFVDGGYYDNFGIDALIGWIASAYQNDPALRKAVPDLLVLQIRHFNPDALSPGRKAGWGFQIVAPLVALLDMWTNSPTHRDRNELDLFVNSYELSGNGPHIQTVTIPYCGLDYRKPVNIARDFAACYASTTTEQLHSRRIS
ncbi:MAG TPA: patatin-like phospholipase family protein, partial [Bryobacteraceae bacterium]|nr:patatin-like phospholipase family protein [Bryobacteraceae bacterium]